MVCDKMTHSLWWMTKLKLDMTPQLWKINNKWPEETAHPETKMMEMIFMTSTFTKQKEKKSQMIRNLSWQKCRKTQRNRPLHITFQNTWRSKWFLNPCLRFRRNRHLSVLELNQVVKKLYITRMWQWPTEETKEQKAWLGIQTMQIIWDTAKFWQLQRSLHTFLKDIFWICKINLHQQLSICNRFPLKILILAFTWSRLEWTKFTIILARTWTSLPTKLCQDIS